MRGLQGGLGGPGRLGPEGDGGALDEAVWLTRAVGHVMGYLLRAMSSGL